jgi:uncharacterized protein (DUF2147 family)
MRSVLIGCLLLAASLIAVPAHAEDSSPVGKWKTIDDASGKPKSIVAIWEEDGKLYGKVEQLLDPDRPEKDPKCTKCGGDLKDKPILGMRIMWDLKKDGDRWSGGKILDPNNGKSYRCNLALTEDGKKLMVRGFIGMALLGRTQTWTREE